MTPTNEHTACARSLDAYQIQVVRRQASECGPPIAGGEDESPERSGRKPSWSKVPPFYGPSRNRKDGTAIAGQGRDRYSWAGPAYTSGLTLVDGRRLAGWWDDPEENVPNSAAA